MAEAPPDPGRSGRAAGVTLARRLTAEAVGTAFLLAAVVVGRLIEAEGWAWRIG